MSRTPDSGLPDEISHEALQRGLAAAFARPAASSAGNPIDSASREPATRYELRNEIGRGGIGAVFRSQDHELGREVAVKLLHAEHLHRTQLVARFVAEAQITGQLQHPGIVPIYEMGQLAGDRPFIAMKLVEGQTLAELLDGRGNPNQDRRRLLSIFGSVCQTVAFAHARNVVHRDLKPGNIMVGSFGEVQVLDWGFAKVLRPDPSTSPSLHMAAPPTTVRSHDQNQQSIIGSVMGTPAYMPREQARGELHRVGPRSDVFALGAILCEVLTGHAPYLAIHGDLLQQAVRGDTAPAIARLAACGAEPELILLANACLDPDPAGRPASAQDVAQAMETFFETLEQRAEHARVEAASARLRARAAAGYAVLILLVFASAATGYMTWRGQRDARSTTATQLANEALREASALQERAMARGAGDLSLWTQAAAAAERATLRAQDTDVPPQVLLASQTVQRDVQQSHEQAKLAAVNDARDQSLLTALAAIRLPTDDDVTADDFEVRDARRLAAAYEQTLSTWLGGKSPRQLEDAEAQAKLAVRNVTARIVDALDHWALACSVLIRDDPAASARNRRTRSRLLQIADLLDDDPWRTRLRRVLVDPFLLSDDLLKLAASANRNLPAAAAWILGHTLWQVGSHQEATEAFQRGCDEHPDDAQLWFAYGFALQRAASPRYAEAEHCYRTVRGLAPHLREPQHRLGLAQFELRRYEEAAATFQRLLAGQPEEAHWRAHLCDALMRRRRFREALEFAEAGLAAAPKIAQLHAARARSLLALGRQQEAEEALEEAARLEPTNMAVRYSLASALQKRGVHERAIFHYRTLAAESQAATAYTNLAVALLMAGQRKEAAEQLHRALAVDPNCLEALTGLGRLLAEAGQYKEARMRFEQALVIDPKFAPAHEWYAVLLRTLNDNREARRHIELALQNNPNSADLHEVLGTLQERLGEAEAAETSYLHSLELDANRASTFVNLGNLKRRRGEHGKALDYYDRALAMRPRLAMAHVCKGLSLLALERHEEAIQAMQTALQLDSHLTDVHSNLAQAYLLSNQHLLAIEQYQLALKAMPQDPVAHFNVATVLAYDDFDPVVALRHAREAQRLLQEPDLRILKSSRRHIEERLPKLLADLEQAATERSRLLAIATGELRSATRSDLLQAARAAYHERLHEQSTKVYLRLLEEHPGDLGAGGNRTRYHAACSAVLAAAASQDQAAALQWQQQARTWLQQELRYWQSPESNASATTKAKVLHHWQRDQDLITVRSSDEIRKLPTAEQLPWQDLWQEVASFVTSLER